MDGRVVAPGPLAAQAHRSLDASMMETDTPQFSAMA
jgi:hypothetical protein